MVSQVSSLKQGICIILHYNLIVLQPDSVNVIANSPVQFSCTGVGNTFNFNILYFVNGKTVNNFVDEGFIQTPNQEQLDDETIRRNLTLNSAKIDYNNTEIQCHIENIISGETEFSATSVIKIQGMI